jgi:hypothetical protein
LRGLLVQAAWAALRSRHHRNKGWFIILRIYGPLQPWFDQTWQPDDIVPVK